jgi:hypothetical protein
MDANISLRFISYSSAVKNRLTFSNSDNRSYAVVDVPELVTLFLECALPPKLLEGLVGLVGLPDENDNERFSIDLGDGCWLGEGDINGGLPILLLGDADE